jgi:phosphoglycolate phosphatase
VLRLEIDDVAETAVAGDTTSDLLAGTRAGASMVVGVLTGAHSREELESVPRTHVIGSITELPSLALD